MSKKTVIYLLIGVFAIGFLLSKYNEYKEKNLVDLFTNVKTIAFEIHSDDIWKTDKKEAIEELTKYLSQYQVEKMKDVKEVVYHEAGFWLRIQTNNKTMMVLFNEEQVFIPAVGNYKVINNPIDIEWLENFQETYRE